jgi:hypothetical protein
VDDLIVGEVLAVIDERANERRRLCGAGADEDTPSGCDTADGFCGRDDAGSVSVLPLRVLHESSFSAKKVP